MPIVEQSVDVDVDTATAYEQWSQFESFPQWMEGVASVDQLGDGRLHWVAKVREEYATFEGETREWDAHITEQTPDRRIAWESVGGEPGAKPSAGGVTFEPLGGSSCRVTFTIDWEPEGGFELPDEVLAAVNQVSAADLARFKEIIEGRRRAG